MKSSIIVLALAAALLGAVTAGCGDQSSEASGSADVATTAEQSDVTLPPALATGDLSADTGASSDTSVVGDTDGAYDNDDDPDGYATDEADDSDDPAGSAVTLTSEETEGILFMREEEKLARDVYLTLFDVWGLPVFENIAAAESRHTGAVLGLIDQYGLEDPVVDDSIGAFTNPDLAALYDDLIASGSESLVDALSVGALIEDLDIADLRAWLEMTDNPSIERVYDILLRGSENHLRSFLRQLEGQGATYEPTYLTPDDVAEILAGQQGNGGQGGGGGRNH